MLVHWIGLRLAHTSSGALGDAEHVTCACTVSPIPLSNVCIHQNHHNTPSSQTSTYSHRPSHHSMFMTTKGGVFVHTATAAPGCRASDCAARCGPGQHTRGVPKHAGVLPKLRQSPEDARCTCLTACSSTPKPGHAISTRACGRGEALCRQLCSDTVTSDAVLMREADMWSGVVCPFSEPRS